MSGGIFSHPAVFQVRKSTGDGYEFQSGQTFTARSAGLILSLKQHQAKKHFILPPLSQGSWNKKPIVFFTWRPSLLQRSTLAGTAYKKQWTDRDWWKNLMAMKQIFIMRSHLCLKFSLDNTGLVEHLIRNTKRRFLKEEHTNWMLINEFMDWSFSLKL